MNETAEPIRLYSDVAISVQTRSHIDETRAVAATLVAEDYVGGDPANECPKAIAWLASKAAKANVAKHVNRTPEDVGCGCEEENWWCPDADGPMLPFWEFDIADIKEFQSRGDREATYDSRDDDEDEVRP